MRSVIITALFVVALVCGSRPGIAADERWCAIYTGGHGGGGVNCGFYTLQQCRDTINLSGERCEFDYMYQQEQEQKTQRARQYRRQKKT